jgi:vacuole morphology and inheritance protein 14
VHAISGLPLGAEVLVQIDRLVQLLEAPAFTGLRLQLLQPARHAALIRAMYGLLMVLPQSGAFKTLHARLSSVPTLALMQLDGGQPAAGGRGGGRSAGGGGGGGGDWADWPRLTAAFVERQRLHAEEEERKRARLEGLSVEEEIKEEQEQQAAVAAAELSSAAAAVGGVGGQAEAADAQPPQQQLQQPQQLQQQSPPQQLDRQRSSSR